MPDVAKTALITGASSGIGNVFAKHLAARGYALLLTARRRNRLEALAAELTRQHGVSAEVVPADLTLPDDVERLADVIRSHPNLDLLINNAGFGTRHHYVELDLAMQLDMVRVHVLATMHLTHVALPAMIRRGRGAVINVASMAAFLPMPRIVTYASTKAFLVTFSEALAKELKNTGVRIEALCPGFTYTEFHDAPEFNGFDRSDTSKALWMSADDVVAESLSALETHRVVCVPGRRNRFFLRLIRSPIGKTLLRALAGRRWE